MSSWARARSGLHSETLTEASEWLLYFWSDGVSLCMRRMARQNLEMKGGERHHFVGAEITTPFSI